MQADVLVRTESIEQAPLAQPTMGERSVTRNCDSKLKRTVDYAVTVPLALVLVPLGLVIYLLIRIVDPGPGVFCQEREGLNGKTFTLFKFRTMYVDAEDRLEAFLSSHPERRAEWEDMFRLDDDPRLLPVIGKFLRATSLDELPNLWSILKGDMSLVGPRPFPAYHLDRFDEEFRTLRSSVWPGATGTWQIHRGGLAVQQRCDEDYIAHWSHGNDLRILLKTVPVICFARKAQY